MADATARDLTAATDVATTDVLVLQQNTGSALKITGANVNNALESGGGVALSLAADQAPAAGADTRLQYNNGGSRGGDAEVVWDNSGKVLTLGAVTATTQAKLRYLTFGDGDTSIYEQSDDVLRIQAGANVVGIFSANRVHGFGGFGAGDFRGGLQNEAASSTNPTLLPKADDDDTGVGTAAADQLSLIAGGAELVRLSESAKDQAMFYCPPRSSFGSDSDIRKYIFGNDESPGWFASSLGFIVDEDNDKLEFWVRYSGGSPELEIVKHHELAIS